MALEKAPDAFRTISEVSDDLDVPQHVLRFWETRFGQIRPMKRSGGRRFYRPDDIDLLKGIRRLLYAEGYTIRGVQRILKEQGVRAVQMLADSASMPPPPDAQDRKTGQGELRLLGEDGIDVPAPDDEPIVDRTDDLDDDEDLEAGAREILPDADATAEPDIPAATPAPIDVRDEPPAPSAGSRQPERSRTVAARRPLATPTARADAVSPPGADAPMTREARLRAILDDLLACRAILSAAMEPE